MKRTHERNSMSEFSRRQFMQVGAVGAMTAFAGTGAAQEITSDATGFQSVALLHGPASARPAAGSSFFDNKTYFAYIYEDKDGQRSYITQDDSSWSPLNYLQQATIFSRDDLPSPTNGTHTLEDNTAYVFNGFVTSPYGLELGTATPLIGRHGSIDGFIHTGQNTALVGTDAGFFARDLYFHAPGGTMFDLTATQSTEMLVESCSFSDAAGLGEIASLGTIDGYRVPSFKGVNFENFASGLTFDGTPDKIFFEGCPFRGVTASNVTIVTFASTLDVDIAKLSTDCYIKDVQSDTVVVDAQSQPNEYFKYINVDHDSTVTKSNILTGTVGAQAVGTVVTDSFPLADSEVTGELDLDSSTTVTGSGAAPAQVVGTTTLNNAERTSTPSNGVIQYDGKPDEKTIIHINASVSGANTEYAVYVGRNGSPISRSRALGFLANSSSPTGTTALAELKLVQGDTVSAYIENVGGTKDLTVETLAITV